VLFAKWDAISPTELARCFFQPIGATYQVFFLMKKKQLLYFCHCDELQFDGSPSESKV
jgi:hypothetical protein